MIAERLVAAFLTGGIFLTASAHSPICDCFDNGDGSVTCEGGFSDGASAAGVGINIYASNGKLLVEGAMSDVSDFTFEMPDQAYRVVFEAGDGHTVEIDGRDIEE